MPMDRSRYPANWDEIATSVKERAGWKCEECSAEHGDFIRRRKGNPEVFRSCTDEEAAAWVIRDPFDLSEWDYPVRVVLTVHHVGVDKPDGTPGSPHDKMDCRPENLKALCQRCHLIADAPHRMVATRIEANDRQRRAGQQELW